MSAISAKFENAKTGPETVVFVVYPNIALLDLTGPLHIFTTATRKDQDAPAYTPKIASLSGDRIETDTVISVSTEKLSNFVGKPIQTLFVVGGYGAYDAMRDSKLLEYIALLAEQAERVCSACAGALVLAAAGVLDHRRVVTHWADCKQLEDEFPAVRVDVDPIFLKDGNVWTSAGHTAGTDMALALVGDDLGGSVSFDMARSMVAQMIRSGGQSQFNPALDRQFPHATGRFEELHNWIVSNLSLDLHVEDLAKHVNMSPRNFARSYRSQMGMTPAKAIERLRTETARELLIETKASLKEISTRCGFKDHERMRRAFLRSFGIPPSEYRKNFQAS